MIASLAVARLLAGKKGIKPKPKTIKRMKLKPGEKLPADEIERRLAHLTRMARGELGSDDDSSSSSDDDDSSSDDVSDGGGGEKRAEKQVVVQAAPLEAGGETRQLAVCNLDWDHLGATDVFKLMDSFMPPVREKGRAERREGPSGDGSARGWAAAATAIRSQSLARRGACLAVAGEIVFINGACLPVAGAGRVGGEGGCVPVGLRPRENGP